MKIILTNIVIALMLLHPWMNTETTAPGSDETHDFHISKSLIRHQPAESRLQVEMHVFLDDLESALEQAGAPNPHLATELEIKDADIYLQRYLRKHFSLRSNGTALPYQFVGYELSDDMAGLWVYLEAPMMASSGKLSVRNTLLTDIYDDQKNIVNFIGRNSKREMLLFSRDRRDGELNY